ncbi:hypothetical protein MRX96_029459 [Rhipicephalus microplus]
MHASIEGIKEKDEVSKRESDEKSPCTGKRVGAVLPELLAPSRASLRARLEDSHSWSQGDSFKWSGGYEGKWHQEMVAVRGRKYYTRTLSLLPEE